MNQEEAVSFFCVGTSEGAKKGWDTRGRGTNRLKESSAVQGAKYYSLPDKVLDNAKGPEDYHAHMQQMAKASVGRVSPFKSFDSPEQASSYSAKLLDRGRTPIHMDTGDGMYHVTGFRRK
jgi:hypothetical protein